MSKEILAIIINICLNNGYTDIQKNECITTFGSCMADYNNKKPGIEKCQQKWEKEKGKVK